jgi:hypothetical protein
LGGVEAAARVKAPLFMASYISSYLARLSLSPKTSYASLISLNFSALLLLPALASGWYFFASFRNVFLISSAAASFETPRTL